MSDNSMCSVMFIINITCLTTVEYDLLAHVLLSPLPHSKVPAIPKISFRDLSQAFSLFILNTLPR